MNEKFKVGSVWCILSSDVFSETRSTHFVVLAVKQGFIFTLWGDGFTGWVQTKRKWESVTVFDALDEKQYENFRFIKKMKEVSQEIYKNVEK